MLEKSDLVFGGCGSALACYAGAYKRWSKLYQPKRLIGTSGGAIIIVLIAMGWSPDKIISFFEETPINSLLDRPLSGLLGLGWYSGHKIWDTLDQICPYTFQDFKDHALTIITGNYSKHCAEYCSPELTPTMKVSDAVRRSMSIPFLFKYVKDPITKDIYIDGGVYNNFGIDYWKDSTAITGFRLVGAHNKAIPFVNPTSTLDIPKNAGIFALNILNDLMAISEQKHIESVHWNNVCTIYTDVNGMDLNQDRDAIDKMIQQGYDSCALYLTEAKKKKEGNIPLIF